ncbi:hypothetical protein GCM10009742_75200 [Kribbella karoonensis]|uniref:Uncharacterized protein n=1 Tax=Kribbella karoonensis TaxID=324851 RepID=A0ABN2EPD5_9ACTN
MGDAGRSSEWQAMVMFARCLDVQAGCGASAGASSLLGERSGWQLWLLDGATSESAGRREHDGRGFDPSAGLGLRIDDGSKEPGWGLPE